MNKLFLKFRIWRLENKLQSTCEDIGYYQAGINSNDFTWIEQSLNYHSKLGKLKVQKEFLTAKLERLKSQLNESLKTN